MLHKRTVLHVEPCITAGRVTVRETLSHLDYDPLHKMSHFVPCQNGRLRRGAGCSAFFLYSQSAFLSAAICKSVFWSSVETRA